MIRHGRGGSPTDVVCGFLHSEDALFDPALRVFPPVFVVRPPDGPGSDWVRANIDYRRLHLARDLLASTDLGVAAIARRIGYDAEEAFSRAFKRAYGTSPTNWRACHPLR